jgi:rod shape-determining protein MreC
MQVLHKKKQNKKIIIYIVLFVILIIINPFNVFGFVRNIVMIPLTPVTRQGSIVGIYISDKLGMIFNIGTLYQNNQNLENKVRQLEAENALLMDVSNENDELRSSLELLPRDEFKFIGGDVILRDSLGGNQWVMLNRGKRDGVAIGKAVVVGENVLVGIVDEVNDTTARVQLITHPESAINVVTARTGAQAIVLGLHGLSVTVEDIKMDDDVINGDMFVTSDIGNSFPRGLSVGIVQNITPSTDKLFQNATIIPSVSLDRIQHLFVIK